MTCYTTRSHRFVSRGPTTKVSLFVSSRSMSHILEVEICFLSITQPQPSVQYLAILTICHR